MSSTNVENWYVVSDLRQAIQVKNGTIVRPFSISPDWTTIQLGMWFSFSTGSLANLTGTPRLYFGVCSGGTNVIGDATVDHFLGFRMSDDIWAYTSASAYTALIQYSQTGNYIRQVGTAISSSADVISSNYLYMTPNTNGEASKAGYQFLQITKGNPNYTIQTYIVNSYSNANYGLTTETDFLAQLQSSVPTTNTIISLQATTALGLECSEATHGTFDHICVAWDREEPVGDLIIYGLGIAVLA